MKQLILLFLGGLSHHVSAQNIFPVKLDNCKTDRFCLDCGDVKAGFNQEEFNKLLEKLKQELNLQGIKGGVKFQVLVNAKGKACVLSHTDPTKHAVTTQIIEALNQFDKWTPALTSNKPEEKASITVIFVIKDNKHGVEREMYHFDG